MADVFTKKKRSEIMSRIRGKNTKLESDFLKKLSAVSHAKGYRYRKHYAKLPGKPDIAFPGRKIAVFIDGCFWHGCKKHSRVPLSNVPYWSEKIGRNRARDVKNTKILKKEGWTVLRFWEHDVKKQPETAIKKILKTVISKSGIIHK
jgi:DNA mismatch endonuclease (patch repair protein)